MTLCIAWLEQEEVHFASDSRISLQNNFVDFGIKILSKTVNVYHSDKPKFSGFQPIQTQQIGICAAGSFLTFFMTVESLTEVLKNLQFSQGYSVLSMESICKIIKFFYEKMNVGICNALGGNGILTMIVTGYCFDNNKFKTFKFEIDASNYPIKSNYSEILIDKNYIFIGSGEQKATEIKNQNCHKEFFEILRDVIEDSNIDTVNGPIQYGKTNITTNDFEIVGISCVTQDLKGDNVAKYYLNSLEMYTKEFSDYFTEVSLAEIYILPFE
jgi:hypothetical protein